MTIELHETLLAYPMYKSLHGEKVKVNLNSKHREWLSIHRKQFLET